MSTSLKYEMRQSLRDCFQAYAWQLDTHHRNKNKTMPCSCVIILAVQDHTSTVSGHYLYTTCSVVPIHNPGKITSEIDESMYEKVLGGCLIINMYSHYCGGTVASIDTIYSHNNANSNCFDRAAVFAGFFQSQASCKGTIIGSWRTPTAPPRLSSIALRVCFTPEETVWAPNKHKAASITCMPKLALVPTDKQPSLDTFVRRAPSQSSNAWVPEEPEKTRLCRTRGHVPWMRAAEQHKHSTTRRGFLVSPTRSHTRCGAQQADARRALREPVRITIFPKPMGVLSSFGFDKL